MLCKVAWQADMTPVQFFHWDPLLSWVEAFPVEFLLARLKAWESLWVLHAGTECLGQTSKTKQKKAFI